MPFINSSKCHVTIQASQSGYAVDYVTQGAHAGFPGSFLNQNSQAGYSRFGSGNDFMSQVGLFIHLLSGEILSLVL